MLKPLTSLRFFAALLVFVVHDVPVRGLAAAFSFGYAGVSFFFVLSGFILTFTYHREFTTALRGDAIRSFYVARIARIYPLHLVATALMLIAVVLFGGWHWSEVSGSVRITELLAQVTMLQSWFPERTIHFGLNGPAWTISVEAFFYLLFPVLAFVLVRATRVGGEVLPLVLAGALWVTQTLFLMRVQAVWDQWNLCVFPPARLADFVIGMLLAIAFLRRSERPLSQAIATRLELGALLSVVTVIAWSPAAPMSLRFTTLFLPFWAVLIYLFAKQQGDVSRSLTHPVFVRLGEASYAFYLIHLTVLQVITQLVGWSHPLPWSLLAFGVSLGASLALYSFVETPLRRRIRDEFNRSRVPRPAPSALAA